MVVYLSLPSSETQTSDFDRELVTKVATEHTDKNSHRNSCQLKRSFFSKKMESIVPWNRLCCVLASLPEIVTKIRDRIDVRAPVIDVEDPSLRVSSF